MCFSLDEAAACSGEVVGLKFVKLQNVDNVTVSHFFDLVTAIRFGLLAVGLRLIVSHNCL